MTNLFTHAPDGRASMKPIQQDSSSAERFTHVLEEISIRGMDYKQPKILEAMSVPQPKSPRVMRGLDILSRNRRKPWPEHILVKFGKRKYMAELLLAGKGRVSRGGFYKDESLGRARADNEGHVAAYLHPQDAHRFMGIHSEPNGSFGQDLSVPYLGSVEIQIQANTDFYVYCLAEAPDVRMFDDFDADSCLVITRPEEFKTRIRAAISPKLSGWKFIAGPVIYFDPFFSHVHEMVPHFWKHFRFGYQKEHRMLWLPPLLATRWHEECRITSHLKLVRSPIVPS